MANRSRELMINDLLQWKSHWKKETVLNWNDKILVSVYTKELDKRNKSSRKKRKTSLEKEQMIEKILLWDHTLTIENLTRKNIFEIEDIYVPLRNNLIAMIG